MHCNYRLRLLQLICLQLSCNFQQQLMKFMRSVLLSGRMHRPSALGAQQA